jgi:hypothetical protein
MEIIWQIVGFFIGAAIGLVLLEVFFYFMGK